VKSPIDQPDHQEEPDDDDQGDQLVRRDAGGWISGPCLNAEELGLLADFRPDPGATRPEGQRQRPVQ
jgi:hypothetical protein